MAALFIYYVYYMKVKHLLSYLLLTATLSSCIQDEALNVEAAIDACTGTDVQFAYSVNNNRGFNIYVNKGADLSRQTLTFTVPQGATIEISVPTEGDGGITQNENGTYTAILNFNNDNHTRLVTVVSEDLSNRVEYTIRVILMELPTRYHFERLQTSNAPYHILLEEEPVTSEGLLRTLQWCSGNPGYELTKVANTPQEYPTAQADEGYVGKCVKLQTLSTGSFGAMVGMNIAAGNLFIGSFDLSNALTNAPAATHFGVQFYKMPSRLKGYYKFRRGEAYTEKGETVSGKQDSFDIYAFLYEAEDNSFMLDGSNALTDPSVVLLARIDQANAVETDAWRVFDLPFESRNGKNVNAQKLTDGKYKLGIVFSSSIDGAYFKGAVGSTLYIDEVELICEEDQ